MAVHPICAHCYAELDDYGALLFAPPDDRGRTQKYHFCLSCFETVRDFLAKPARNLAPSVEKDQVK